MNGYSMVKDPKVIAGLVKDGRYSSPYMPEGIYADIRELSNLRLRNNEELIRAKNRLARWFDIYFPEIQDVYSGIDSKSGMAVLQRGVSGGQQVRKCQSQN